MKTIYVAGKISGKENYRADFERARKKLSKIFFQFCGSVSLALDVLDAGAGNPADGGKPLAALPELPALRHKDYLHICFAMIDVCDAVYLLPDWKASKGARMERIYAEISRKVVLEEGEDGVCKELES